MNLPVHLLISLSFVAYVLCSNYFFGKQTPETRLINREKVVYFAIPWKKRVIFYNYTDTLQRTIKAINCYDYQRTEAKVNLTDGGVGYSFVSLRFKSQRSFGLEYAVEIFA